MLRRVLNCHHSWKFETRDKIHKYYYSHLKAQVRQLRFELINTIAEYVTKFHAITDSLITIGESISKQDITDIILDGLSEEYNAFVMMIYDKADSPNLTEIESLLLVHKRQLDKFR